MFISLSNNYLALIIVSISLLHKGLRLIVFTRCFCLQQTWRIKRYFMFDPLAFSLRKVADESKIFVRKRCVYEIERWRMKTSSRGRLRFFVKNVTETPDHE
jgi:hypothetical protein